MGRRLERMYNLTTHDESGDIEKFKSFGFDIDPQPRLFAPPYGRTPREPMNMYHYAKATVDNLPSDAEAVLIGGLTDLMIYIYNIIKESKSNVRIYIAATRRMNKNNDYEILHLREVI